VSSLDSTLVAPTERRAPSAERRRRRGPVIVLALASTLTASALTRQTAPGLEGITTTPEKTDYKETSKYADVIAFLEAIDKASPRVHLTTFGTTNEKRSLPLAVVGAPDATAQAVKQTGKLRVYIQGNIHGGEVEGKESAQMLVRDLAAGTHDDWLKSIVFLIAPIYNADGNERFALNNRGPQNGPLGGQGQRPNAQNLDLNRDHMKLDSPEARGFVTLMNDYDPHVSLDLHTTNGTRHAYMLTYSPPLHPGTDAGIIGLLRKEWFPAVTASIKRKYGWNYFYYGNLGEGRGGGQDAAQPRWATFDHRPRFNNNYIGLRNRFALLSEAYAYATFQDRILATNRFIDEALTFAAKHADRIKASTAAADRRTIVGTELPLSGALQHTGTIEILMGEVAEEKHPVDGHTINVRKDVETPKSVADYSTFRGVNPERVPSSYYVPSTLRDAVDRLTAHGIVLTPLKSATRVEVEEFRIDASETAATAFQNHHERMLKGAWIAAERELPAGTLRIDLRQPLARLAFYLLEPRADDGLVNWNVLDAALADAKVYPIVRSRN
jgi:hypothetical protein